MSVQECRKALWHLRHGAIEGLSDYKRKSKSTDDLTDDLAVPDRVRPQKWPATLSVVVPMFNASDFIEKCPNG